MEGAELGADTGSPARRTSMGGAGVYSVQQAKDQPPAQLSPAQKPSGLTDRYARFLVRCPCVPILLVLAVNIVFGTVCYFFVDFPDFSDPIEMCWYPCPHQSLMDWLMSHGLAGESCVNQDPPHRQVTRRSHSSAAEGFEARGTDIKGRLNAIELLRTSSGLKTFLLPNDHIFGQDTDEAAGSTRRISARKKRDTIQIMCLRQHYVYDSSDFHLVLGGSQQGSNLWTVKGLRALCSMEDQLTQGLTCWTPSVARYVAQMTGVQCEGIEQTHLDKALDVLRSCAPHYYRGTFTEDCTNDTCPDVPHVCIESRAYIIFHYLTDSKFISEQHMNSTEQPVLAYTSLYLPTMNKEDLYLNKFADITWENAEVEVVAVDSSPKMELFETYIMSDMVFFGLAMGLILVVMCLYLRSLAVTIATILDVVFSLVIAYFLYHMVFRIKYFPFMNLLTGLIVIAIGADDVFILFDTWQQTKLEHPEGDMVTWTSLTLHHAILSIFVTSLTTASAFFASFVSEITSIKCFAIFSGVAILANFLMMVLWIPPIIILIEKTKRCCGCFRLCAHSKYCQRFVWGLHKMSRFLFGKWLPYIVLKLRYLWIALFLCIGIGGVVIVFVTPKLELPSSQEFQMFQSNNLLERYENLKYEFRYKQRDREIEYKGGMDIVITWGMKGKDNGNALNPKDKGKLELDNSFDMSSKEAQLWMTDFCHDLKNSSFLSQFDNRQCSMDLFNQVMTYNCATANLVGIQAPCCGHKSVPVSADVFNECLPKLMRHMYSQGNSMGTPRFDEQGKLRVLLIYFSSVQPWTASFVEMDTFYQDLENFIDARNSKAPSGVNKGWFITELQFFDLQKALSSGTYVAIGVSLAVASIVMLLTSLNVLITLYAIVTIAFSISVTVAILVLLGWELNILESIVISLAVGLSIDFAIHYGVAYRLSSHECRRERVKESFGRVGSAVIMAALTTFLAGTAMMPCKVLSYTQLGTFLMLVMLVSWVYATFFFQALCAVIGPQGNTAQIPSPFLLCQRKRTEASANAGPCESIRVNPEDEETAPNEPSGSFPALENNGVATVGNGVDNKAFEADHKKAAPLKY